MNFLKKHVLHKNAYKISLSKYKTGPFMQHDNFNATKTIFNSLIMIWLICCKDKIYSRYTKCKTFFFVFLIFSFLNQYNKITNVNIILLEFQLNNNNRDLQFKLTGCLINYTIYYKFNTWQTQKKVNL